MADTRPKPNLSGLTFSELAAFREDVLQSVSALFDRLVSGESKASAERSIDTDPFHDRPPMRWLKMTVAIDVRQDKRNG